MKFDEKKVISAINYSWGWAIKNPRRVLAVSSMGNVLLVDDGAKCWRVCPEELSVKVVATDQASFEVYFSSPENKADWQLSGLADEAENKFGVLNVGDCYAMRKPAVIGGEYSVSNLYVDCLYEYLYRTGKWRTRARILIKVMNLYRATMNIEPINKLRQFAVKMRQENFNYVPFSSSPSIMFSRGR